VIIEPRRLGGRSSGKELSPLSLPSLLSLPALLQPHAFRRQLTSASDSSSPSSLCCRRATACGSVSPAELLVSRRCSGGGPQADPPLTKNLERRPPTLLPCAPLLRALAVEFMAACQSAADIWLNGAGGGRRSG
jgi:hypothetical protein